jgi:hypothetical protein
MGEGRRVRRYFFHLVIGPIFIRDREGAELADDATARTRALSDIASAFKAGMIKRQDRSACAVVVEDSEGPRFRVRFAEARESD